MPEVTIPPELGALTPKQRDFVFAYIETKNGTEAARRAGYKGTDDTLSSVSKENLRKPLISAALAALTAPVIKKHLITVDSVMGEIATIAFAEASEKLKHKDKLAALKMAGDHVGAFKLAGDGSEAPRYQFAVNMSEEEARVMLQSLLKK